jgi:hypothetical protein
MTGDGRRDLPSAVHALAVAGVLATAFVLAIRVVTHHPFFDETLHLRFLWLLSTGERAYRDFFCQYPVTGYYAALPLFRSLPETAWVVLPLRFLSLAAALGAAAVLGHHGRRVAGSWVWGSLPFLMVASTPEIGNFLVEYNTDQLALLAAVGAFVFFAAEPSAKRVALAAALSVLSALVMPKYAPMLFLGGIGCLLSAGRRVGWRVALAAGGAGGAAAGGAVWGLLASQGIALGDLFEMLALQSRWTIGRSDYDVTIAELTGHFLARHWPLAALFALGLGAWVTRHRRELLGRQLPLLAMLVATFLYAVRVKSVFEQMLLPVLVVLAFFVPYAGALLRRRSPPAQRSPPGRRFPWPEVALALATLTSAGAGFAEAKGELRQTCWGRDCESPYIAWPSIQPGVATLKEIDDLLRLIPPHERVVAMWHRHPLFRRDLTWVTFDERGGYARGMTPDDPLRQRFDPAVFAEALARTPPAYVSLFLLEENYPPGWLQVLLEFLQQRAGAYSRFVRQDGDVYFVRNDLLGR